MCIRDSTYVVEAHEKGGAKAAKDIEELVSEVTGMFAGGELSEDAIEGADVYKRQAESLQLHQSHASAPYLPAQDSESRISCRRCREIGRAHV